MSTYAEHGTPPLAVGSNGLKRSEPGRPGLSSDPASNNSFIHGRTTDGFCPTLPADVDICRTQQKPALSHHYCLNLIDGLRILPQPHQIEVSAADGLMSTVTLDHNHRHAVKQTNGPWRLSGHWWNGSYDRLYYEVETDEHRMYLMFFDRTRSSWYMQGMFD